MRQMALSAYFSHVTRSRDLSKLNGLRSFSSSILGLLFMYKGLLLSK